MLYCIQLMALSAIDYYTPGILKYAGCVIKSYSSLSPKRDPGPDQTMFFLGTTQYVFIADKQFLLKVQRTPLNKLT